jgi:DNA repair exonuclease SbcCD ATPase subunit
MKRLMTGDWQLDDLPPCDRLAADGRSTRARENCDAIRGMVRQAASLGVTNLTFLGDLTEFVNPNSASLDLAADLFREILDLGWTIDAIAGNHDGKLFGLSSSSIAPLAKMARDRFRVFHEPFIDYSSGLIALPYMHRWSLDDIKKRFDSLRLASPDRPHRSYFLAAHYAARGCVIGSANSILPGDHLDASHLPADMIQAGFFGHIHKHQVVKMPFQDSVLGEAEFDALFPGSPVHCDFGERNDLKGFYVYDDETYERQWHQIKPKRAWIVADYQNLVSKWEDAGQHHEAFHGPWAEGDIIKISGTCKENEDYSKTIESMVADVTNKPFFVKPEVVAEKPLRKARGEEISGAEDFREAASRLVKKTYPDDPKLMEDVLAIVLDLLGRQTTKNYGDKVTPVSLRLVDYMTFKDFYYEFAWNEPTLIIGPNGLGKTNLFQALLLAMGGDTSKGIELSTMVRQGAKSSLVEYIMDVDGVEWKITVKLKLQADGGAAQELSLHKENSKAKDGWEDRSDGGNKAVRAEVAAMIGMSFIGLKSMNFMFQKDPSPFIKAGPKDRKKVFAEVQGLDPILKAAKAGNELRLEHVRAFQDAENQLSGALAVAAQETAKLPGYREQLQKASQALQEASGAVTKAEAAEQHISNLVSLKRADLSHYQQTLAQMPDAKTKVALLTQEFQNLELNFNKVHEQDKATYYSKEESRKVALQQLTDRSAKKPGTALVEAKFALERARADYEEFNRRHTEIVAERMRCDSEVVRINNGFKAFEGLDIGTCSKCKQPIDSKHILQASADLRAELAKAQEAVEVMKMTETVSATKLAEFKAPVQRLELDIPGFQREEQALQEDSRRVDAIVQEQQALIDKGIKDKEDYAKNRQSTLDKLQVADTEAKAQELERKNLESRIEAQKVEVTKHEEISAIASKESREALSAFSARNTEVKLLESSITKAEELAASAEAVQKKVAELGPLVERWEGACKILGPNGLQAYLIDSQIPFLEDRINYYMSRMPLNDLPGQIRSVALSTLDGDTETLAIFVDNGHPRQLEIGAFSGGQLDRVEIALKFAFSDLFKINHGITLGLLCFDEPAGSFDPDGVKGFMNLIFEKCQTDFPVLLFVHHDEKFKQHFDRQLSLAQMLKIELNGMAGLQPLAAQTIQLK